MLIGQYTKLQYTKITKVQYTKVQYTKIIEILVSTLLIPKCNKNTIDGCHLAQHEELLKP